VIVPLNEGELRVLSQPIPLQIQPSDLIVQVMSYDKEKVKLKVLGRGGQVYLSNDNVSTMPMFTTAGTILLGNGEYKIDRGSKHKITITNSLTKERKSWIQEAEGEYLKIEWSFHSEEIEIEKAGKD
ncbi:MAG: hypothetical protein ACPLSK_02745, partial [bacterium]